VETKTNMKVAIVHDWLNGMRGGEKVLEAICEIYPEATLFTLFCEKEKLSPVLKSKKIITSPMQSYGFARNHYRYFLPIMPFFIRSFNLSEYDLIISSSHCVAKGIKKPKNAKHVSYVHAPMRYMWDRFDDYFNVNNSKIITILIAYLMRPFLRYWDYRVSQKKNVDIIIANSRFIAEQIKKNYNRNSTVINPFVDFTKFYPTHKIEKQNYFLAFGAFAPYKKFDLVIDVFLKQKNLNLIIAGSGQDEKMILVKAKNAPNIKIIIKPKDEEVPELYQNARALIFPGLEDFGITPLESLAAKTPVIAYSKGGILDTITSETGITFNEQSVDCLESALLSFIKKEQSFNLNECSNRAQLFTKNQFKSSFQSLVQSFSL